MKLDHSSSGCDTGQLRGYEIVQPLLLITDEDLVEIDSQEAVYHMTDQVRLNVKQTETKSGS